MTDEMCADVCAPEPLGAPGPTSGRNPVDGRFLPGNTAALVTGERSRQFWQAAESARRATRTALLAARGFTERDAPAALAAVADGAAQALLIRDATFSKLMEAGGPTTTHDRRRDVLKVWEAASDRALKHLMAIGLETMERDVLDCSPAEWAARQEQASSTPEAAQDSTSATNDDDNVG
jgi:hypothetical protein